MTPEESVASRLAAAKVAHDHLAASGTIDGQYVMFWSGTEVSLDKNFTLAQLEAIVAAMKAACPAASDGG
jgi:hypothetical protein